MNVYTHHWVLLPNILDCCLEVEYTSILREFKYDHGDRRLRKIAICRVPNRSWNYDNYEVVAIFDKLVAVVTDSMVRPWYCSKISFYTRMSTVMQLNTRILCLLQPFVALFLHGILVVSIHLSSTVIIIVSSTCMRVSKFPLLINLLVFPRSCEHSTTYT